MKVKTRIFELRNGKYKNLAELALAMGISTSQVYRVREGKRHVNEKFIIGAIRAFPQCRLDELFYLVPEPADEQTKKKTVDKAGTRVSVKLTSAPYECGL